ncbi:DUF397 domain-containing protein [Actinomadura rayongensis]|uniref:DUF397 domain-containing protein n=1 Tax=Actinomadura rayongensis TaxID=1429076 RepID=A0A6I4W7P9_9ACTN|nr:DUF397 domain-containing protein [Actinomadura rayongensis]MXQ62732.1 DUF397 domain-containing protein [Actinomadura rayongensis]
MTFLTWRKSSFSGTGAQSDCVEVASLARDIGVRDSKQPDAGHLTLAPETFAALVAHVKDVRA